jgi:pimeloyl-ACP methyl ester carboxylesterase
MKTKHRTPLNRRLALSAGAIIAGGLFGGAAHAQDAALVGPGSGSFSLPGGPGHEEATVTVHYHRPQGFDESSPILIVLPGAGRDGDEYRDSWITASEKHSVLVLSPSYPEDAYDEAAYQLAGLVENLELRNLNLDDPSVYRLADEDIVFDVNDDSSEWLFHDFDRLFDVVAKDVGSSQTEYDLFGHSAGGQIIQRMAIFHPDSKARRMVAANAGFYTLPRLDQPLIFGVADTRLTAEDLERAFREPLTLLLGELDNENETRGTHLRTPRVDEQGIGRLARGRYFYNESQKIAAGIGAEFRWTLEEVPGIGHDFRRMAEAGARLLYETGER